MFLYQDGKLVFLAANNPGPGAPESFALPAGHGKREYGIRILPSLAAGGSVTVNIALTPVAAFVALRVDARLQL